VRHLKQSHKNYICVDANMNDLMRPALYGAYHHITIIRNDLDEETNTFDVVGSLCENNDKFAINRKLPKNVQIGDLLVIHDGGAHGHAMGFNYNGKLRCAEILLKDEKGTTQLIRRRETFEDLFSTLTFPTENSS
jgi:diaminopimelate decarboxylase